MGDQTSMERKFNYDFSGKRALVTGAGRGIGKGIAIALSQCGAETYALSKTKENLDRLVAEHPSIRPVCVDLADWSATRAAVEALPPIDLLINNAAILKSDSFFEMDPETFDSFMEVNVKAVVNVSQIVAKSLMKRDKPGAIVNVSSIAGLSAMFPSITTYSVTKGALTALSRLMAVNLGPHKIRVNCFNPTGSLTDMGKMAFHTEQLKESFKSRTPLGRFAEVSEFVGPVLYLLSDDATMIHGSSLVVDGGFTVA